MTTTGVCCGRCVSAAAANAAIRRLVAGRVAWTPEALAELDRLRAVWREAVARELTGRRELSDGNRRITTWPM